MTIEQNGSVLSIDRLTSVPRPQLVVHVVDEDLLEEGREFIRTIVEYLAADNGKALHPEETIAYGFWHTKLHARSDDALELWEPDEEMTRYVRGIRRILTLWRDQRGICRRYGADFSPPAARQLAAVSQGVLEGDPVQAVRYRAPEHMSGWWLTTDRYDGNIDSLTTEHLFHVTAKRPDLPAYFALPPGFRFNSLTGRVHLDEKVAGSPDP